ncbi:MAG: ZIP family metal transporter [Armatimonadetes bacterium]|nr:ZIP family metal transporter [Armatimonadota bacterium]
MKINRLFFAIIPIAALAILVYGILRIGPEALTLGEVPDVEEITIQWTTLSKGEIKLDVINSGPDPVTIAQVMIDDAYWQFSMEPSDGVLKRLQRGTITIPYHWVEGETHAIRLISRNGVTFDSEIPVAIESPTPNAKSFWTFVLLGVLIGVVPVGLGLLWYPVIKTLSAKVMRFVLALTVGLLVFLGIDTIEEGFEISEALPGAFQGKTLFICSALLVFLALLIIGQVSAKKGTNGKRSPEMLLAIMVALGIGLHNIGEGLAVGSAYVLGEVASASMLVLGFTLHNITEGLAIIAPAARQKLKIRHLVGLGALAGVPTIAGTLIGGFTYSNFWALVFFGVAAGAIFQVVYAIMVSPMMRDENRELALPENYYGFVCGLAIMYGTGLLIAV